MNTTQQFTDRHARLLSLLQEAYDCADDLREMFTDLQDEMMLKQPYAEMRRHIAAASDYANESKAVSLSYLQRYGD